MAYLLFEESAAEKIITKMELQSTEYQMGRELVALIRNFDSEFLWSEILVHKSPNGVMFIGKEIAYKFLFVDLEQCHIRENTTDSELLLMIQKLLRFSNRYWKKQPFTAAENIVGDKAVIFPFPYSQKKSFRIAIAREPHCPRLTKRGISFALLAYKYNDKGAPKGIETPDTAMYQKAGEAYLENRSNSRSYFEKQGIASGNQESQTSVLPLHVVEASAMHSNNAFKYMSLNQQKAKLTDAQRKIVECKELNCPIRVQGPAGTGKTLSLIMRAATLLMEAREKAQIFRVAFFTHSKTTEEAVRLIFNAVTEGTWVDNKEQSIHFTTLQGYCANYIKLSDSQVIDGDAYEAKQYQLLVIQDIYSNVASQYYQTFRPHLSEVLRNFLDSEEEPKIVSLLQHEFSIQIKGYATEDLDVYRTLPPLENGLPVSNNNENDKEYIFKIFTHYQEYLRRDSVFDTDDVVLEAISRFRGPLWKRERISSGYDYIFADEMHLFNLNEQQVFHFLTKDITQERISLCFALDYSQAIGDRGNIGSNYIEKHFSSETVFSQEYKTVFRSSQQIADLCASITSSGATLFSSFINPYETAQSGFTSKEEDFCSMPTLYMYNTDQAMLNSLKGHVDDMIRTIQCPASEIALIFFSKAEIEIEEIKICVGRNVLELISRNSSEKMIQEPGSIVLSTPENINGLEFSGVILVGVDEGRVPITSLNDISENFMRYKALNQLYLACSRAKYQVRILGNSSRGVSSCLNYSLSSKALEKVDC